MIPNGRETIWLVVGVLAGMWLVPKIMTAVQSRSNG